MIFLMIMIELVDCCVLSDRIACKPTPLIGHVFEGTVLIRRE